MESLMFIRPKNIKTIEEAFDTYTSEGLMQFDCQKIYKNFILNCRHLPSCALKLDDNGNVIDGFIMSTKDIFENDSQFFYQGKSFREHLLSIGNIETDTLDDFV